MIENSILNFICAAVIVYLYGAIPFSLIIGLVVYKKDIRTIGSGNIGGTNLSRVGGKQGFTLGFISDMSKGAMAVVIGLLFGIDPMFLVLFALLGHMYSVFIKFKGGKGVATGFGFVLAYTFVGAIIAITIFLICLIISKYVSLSAIIAIGSYVIYTFVQPIFAPDEFDLPLLYGFFAILIFIIVVFSHRKNIVRLINKTENKSYLFGKKE